MSHGAAETLPECLASFNRHVTPAPTDALLYYDGASWGSSLAAFTDALVVPARVEYPRVQEGFCAATAAAWGYAAAGPVFSDAPEPPPDHVYWLEHDFVHLRDVDLRLLAAVLDANTRLAQMQLMRDAVNEQERAAGGLFESRPGEYEPRVLGMGMSVGDAGAGGIEWITRAPEVADLPGWMPWLEHRSYLTTNPSLMRRGFMASNPWPDYPEKCEGRFGIDLVQAGYSFGVWGSGEPWVEHVGVRTGFGY